MESTKVELKAQSTNAARAFAQPKKLLEFAKQLRLDPAAILESRRKDIEALASVNVTVLEGLQTMVRKQAEYLCETAADLQSLAKPKQAGEGQQSARVVEVLPRSLHKAVASLRDMTDTVYKAQADSIATVGKRFAESVEEVKRIRQPQQ